LQQQRCRVPVEPLGALVNVDDMRRARNRGRERRLDVDQPCLVLVGVAENEDHRRVAAEQQVEVALVAGVPEAGLRLCTEPESAGLALHQQNEVQQFAARRVDKVDVPVDPVVDAPRVEQEPTRSAIRAMPRSPMIVWRVTALPVRIVTSCSRPGAAGHLRP